MNVIANNIRLETENRTIIKYIAEVIENFISVEELIEDKIFEYEKDLTTKILKTIRIAFVNIVVLLIAIFNRIIFGNIESTYFLIAIFYFIMTCYFLERIASSILWINGLLWRNGYVKLFKDAFIATIKMKYSVEVSATYGIMHCITKYIKSIKSSFEDSDENVFALFENTEMIQKIKFEISINIYNKIYLHLKNSFLARLYMILLLVSIYSILFLMLKTLVFNNLYNVTVINMVLEPVKIIINELIGWAK